MTATISKIIRSVDNDGGGAEVLKNITDDKVVARTHSAASSKVTVTQSGDQILHDVVEANLTLENIGGTVPLSKGGTGQTSAADSMNALGATRTITTTEGVQGGGTLAADKTLKLDFNGLTEVTPGLINDIVAYYNTADSAHRKVMLRDLYRIMPSLLVTDYDDWITNATASKLNWTASAIGTGSSAQSSAFGIDSGENAQGVWQIDTGTTSTGRLNLNRGVINQYIGSFAYLRTGWRVAIDTLSDGTNTFEVLVGMSDTNGSGLPNNFAGFRYSHSLNGGNWQTETRESLNSTTNDSGVPVVANTFYYLEQEFIFSTTTMNFYIDGVLVASHVSNIPIGVTLGDSFRIEKSVGTTQRNAYVDYYSLFGFRSTVR